MQVGHVLIMIKGTESDKETYFDGLSLPSPSFTVFAIFFSLYGVNHGHTSVSRIFLHIIE